MDKTLHQHFKRALDKRWKTFRIRFKKCRRKYSEPSTHDLRVSIRRLISFFDLLHIFLSLSPSVLKARKKLKKIFNQLSSLRDTQVQALYLEKKKRTPTLIADYVEVLRQQEKRFIKKTKRRLEEIRLKPLKKGRAAIVKRVPLLLELKEKTLRKAIDTTYETVLERERRLDLKEVMTFHLLRIAFKKYRYQIELLVTIFPKITQKRLDAMREFQLKLGAIQDLRVLTTNLRAFVADKPLKERKQAFLWIEKELVRQQKKLMKNLMVKARQDLAACSPQSLGL